MICIHLCLITYMLITKHMMSIPFEEVSWSVLSHIIVILRYDVYDIGDEVNEGT